MAPRSQLVLALAVLFAVLLSSCLLLTDTEVAEPLPEDTGIEDVDGDGNSEDPFEDPIADPETDTDGGEDTAGDLRDLDTTPTDRDGAEDVDARDSGPENGELRCVNRAVETYDGEVEAWEESEVCTREQRCFDGACVDRPEGFGDECDGVEDCPNEEVTCRGGVCLTRAPSEDGGPCMGDEECTEDLICSRRGICQDGGPGDTCIDTDDCDPDLAPFCEDDACVPAGVGEACTSDDTCESDTLYCDPDGFCRAGIEGDACATALQCSRTGRYCGPDNECHDGSTADVCDTTDDCVEADDICKGAPITICQDRGEGDACTGDNQCPTGLYCSESQSECRDGSNGDHCDATDDCDEPDNICKGEPDTTCQGRIIDDVCSGDDDECPGDLYCANGLCQAGGTGAYCDATADCTEVDDICADDPLRCRARVEGDTCTSDDDECPGDLYCANLLCQAGDTGDYCNTTDDCDDVLNICKGAPLRCQERTEGDDCANPDECPATIPICSTDDVCQDGSEGDGCGDHDDCIEANHCDEYTDLCGEDRGRAMDCTDDYQCASDNCSNQHCAPVVEIGEATARFAYIPPETFCMGSPGGGGTEECPDGMTELGRWEHEGPLHQVTLTRGLFLQETEVTQRQWLEFFPDHNPSYAPGCGLDCPVEQVNWWEAVAYVNALSVSEGLEPCYTLDTCDPADAGIGISCTGTSVSDPSASGNPYLCEGYRLPMEAEWEHAYRAGASTPFYNGDITHLNFSPTDPNLDAIAWYGGNAGTSAHLASPFDASDGKAANDWGLYDMAGNVGEWVWDGFELDYYAGSPAKDPLGADVAIRGIRSGSWNGLAQDCRAANRWGYQLGVSHNSVGFRPARSVLTSCVTNDDCAGFTPICGPSDICQAGHENEPCDTVAQCSGDTTICSTAGICQDGSEGDECSGPDDCGADATICSAAGICQDGSEGDACGGASDCASGQCSNDHCAPEGWAYIPPGTFCMGSPGEGGSTECPDEGDPELGLQGNEDPLHQVTLTRPFLLQQTEVTHAQWEARGFTNPSGFPKCGPTCPVERVNWWETLAYLNALSELEGFQPCYELVGCNPAEAGDGITCTFAGVLANGDPYQCEGYRLPTEAEWEYAYRAATTTALHNGALEHLDCTMDTNLNAIGWYCGNAEVAYEGCVNHTDIGGSACAGPHPVGGKNVNGWGLFDMAGNVWEWVWDWYQPFDPSPVENPHGGTGSDRVDRGGSWADRTQDSRAARRNPVPPEGRYVNIGFRPARTLWPAHCLNDIRDGDESAIDCGGSCAGCGLAEACFRDADCASDNCSNAHCAPVVTLGEAEARFAYIPAGTFCMGSPDGDTECMGETPPREGARDTDETLHEVTLTRGFYLQTTEVTQQQWLSLGLVNPSHHKECGSDCPVETLNWWEAAAFANAFSVADGLELCYELADCDPSEAGTGIECTGVSVSDPTAAGNPYLCEGYRLPTEAEWEYGYRAGARTAFPNGDIIEGLCGHDPNLDAIGWYCGNSEVSYEGCDDLVEWGGPACAGSHPVGQKAANAWGLYDMAGNQGEWVWDWLDVYPTGPVENPLGGTGSLRAARGGCYRCHALYSRAADRGSIDPNHEGTGFRLARTAP